MEKRGIRHDMHTEVTGNAWVANEIIMADKESAP